MSGFKLLGIRTGNRIDIEKKPTETDYLKVLKENTYYSFYSSYEFNEETETFTYYPEKDVDLYSITRENNQDPLHINISAIVGENGAGKSTLIELLFLGIHNLAATCKILKDPDNSKENWPIENGVQLDIFYSVNEKIFCIKLNDLDVSYSYQSVNKDNSFSKFKDFKIFEEATKNDLDLFFYSIAINYSLYGLNSKHIGEWIRGLFHKNDGYQTPLVINPMRDEGQININREEGLAKSRLLANLLIQSKSNDHLKLTSKQIVTALTFKLNRRKIKYIYENEWAVPPIKYTFKQLYLDYSNESDFLNTVYSELIGIDRNTVKVNFKEEIEKYIVKKLFKIAHTYKKYKGFLTYSSTTNSSKLCFISGDSLSLKNYIIALKKDNSHITFKLNQAINYIKNNPLVENEEYKWNVENEHFHIPIQNLANRIKTEKLSEIIYLLPPSLFNLEIHLEEIDDSMKKSLFSGLSSGEQQLIHSVQSILYHIINVNSIIKNDDSRDIKYKYVNLILDEIELYFHPAHQKDFIQHILNGIKTLDIPNIKGINMLFSTHSPFILSDIPSQNILRLIKGQAQESSLIEQTFGANIYDLLDNEFFMKDGFIGKYAMFKIKEILDYISDEKYDKTKHDYFLTVTNIIGDEIINQKLNQLLSNLTIKHKDSKEFKISELKQKQKQIEDQLKQLEK